MDKMQEIWNKIQAFLDVSGDVWMGLFTAAIVFRTCSAYFGHSPLTPAESAAYASAVTAFAYSNKGPKV